MTGECNWGGKVFSFCGGGEDALDLSGGILEDVPEEMLVLSGGMSGWEVSLGQ